MPKLVHAGQLRRLKAGSSADNSVGTEPAHVFDCALSVLAVIKILVVKLNCLPLVVPYLVHVMC